MKIKEEDFVDGNNLITVETHDPNPVLERAALARDKGQNWPGMRHIGTIPTFMLEVWMREEGLDYRDTDGINKMLTRKLKDPDFRKLRIVDNI